MALLLWLLIIYPIVQALLLNVLVIEGRGEQSEKEWGGGGLFSLAMFFCRVELQAPCPNPFLKKKDAV